MTLFRKIKLSWNFGRGLYVASAILSLAAAVIILFDPIAVSICLFLKLLTIPVILYLFIAFQDRLAIYFYINMGISKAEYYAIPVAVEFVVFLLLVIVSACIGNVIGH